jgi:hypothetical protein
MRWVAGAALLVLIASGCGSTLAAGEGGSTMATADVIEAAPPIRSVDRATDLSYLWEDVHGGAPGSEVEMCFVANAGSAVDPPQTTTAPAGNRCDSLTAAEKAKLEKQAQDSRNALRPAGEPRVVAELPFGHRETLNLAVWGTAAGELCLYAEARLDQINTASGGPFGPCVDDSRPCKQICVEEIPTDENGSTVALAGVVPADADLITITVRGGKTHAYPLTGPPVPGFASKRIFMADLGNDRYRHIEVTEAGSVLATLDKDPRIVALEECEPDNGASPTPEQMQASKDALQQCLQDHGAGWTAYPTTTRTAAPAGG